MLCSSVVRHLQLYIRRSIPPKDNMPVTVGAVQSLFILCAAYIAASRSSVRTLQCLVQPPALFLTHPFSSSSPGLCASWVGHVRSLSINGSAYPFCVSCVLTCASPLLACCAPVLRVALSDLSLLCWRCLWSYPRTTPTPYKAFRRKVTWKWHVRPHLD